MLNEDHRKCLVFYILVVFYHNAIYVAHIIMLLIYDRLCLWFTINVNKHRYTVCRYSNYAHWHK